VGKKEGKKSRHIPGEGGESTHPEGGWRGRECGGGGGGVECGSNGASIG